MEAILTYSLISAELKKDMFVAINNEILGVVKEVTSEKVLCQCYITKGKRLVLEDYEFTDNNLEIVKNCVIKMLAIVDNNPISINHNNYRKLFNPMLTFPRDSEEAFITTFLKTKEYFKPIIGEVKFIYSKLKKDDVVKLISLEIIDRHSLYKVEDRICTVLSKEGETQYKVRFNNVDIEALLSREQLCKDENDKFNLFEIMQFDTLKTLVENGEAKTVDKPNNRPKTKVKTVNPFYKVAKSDWHASYDHLTPESPHRQWVAINGQTGERLSISIPVDNVPKHQFSGFDNDYWIPGTIKEQLNPTCDMKRFVPFREGLPIFGTVVDAKLGGKDFKYFLLDNIKQESVNRHIYSNRDVTEERRSELTIKKLPQL